MTLRHALAQAREADCAVFGWVADAHTPWLDRALPAVSRAANHSKLWIVCASLAAMSGRRQAQRAAVRGLGCVAATSAVVNLGIKRAVRRTRPSLRRVPAIRHLPVQPLTTSFPSGHAASAAAFATGVAVESPRLAAVLAPVAAAVAYSRVYVGVHYPADVVVGSSIGAGLAGLSRLQWPAASREVRSASAVERPRHLAPNADGAGVVVVANRESGSRIRPDDPVETVRDRLPAAGIVEVDDLTDLRPALERAAAEARVMGIYGGDGSATAAAEAAFESGRALLVLPGGTLNHLASDLRLESVDDALDALQHGHAAEIDVATIDGRPFLNTASFGAYTVMLDIRKALEKRVGRWPAHAVAIAAALLRSGPLEVAIQGRRRRVWMVFIGNCRHEPAGFAPSYRARLDDGVLDVRLLLAERPLARLRLLLSVLAGRLTSCSAYERFETAELRVESGERKLRLARDGESFDGRREFTVAKAPERLVVFSPVR